MMVEQSRGNDFERSAVVLFLFVCSRIVLFDVVSTDVWKCLAWRSTGT